MTANVLSVLAQINDNSLFDDELFFVGGTALSFYINHRISEDIDIVSSQTLNYKKIIPQMHLLNATKIQDENVTALRMAGLFPDEYMIKFILNEVKIEFFQANRSIQKEILQKATFSRYQDSHLKVLDLKSIAKLKLVALFQREKSRDLFDFGAILSHNILTPDEILEIASKIKRIVDSEQLYKFIEAKQEPQDDESVYLSEENSSPLAFSKIKTEALEKLKPYCRL